jgi:hypothetical protein
MSLLTLIILGEGVIGSTKSIAKIVQNNETFSGAVVGQIISAVLIIVSQNMFFNFSRWSSLQKRYVNFYSTFSTCSTSTGSKRTTLAPSDSSSGLSSIFHFTFHLFSCSRVSHNSLSGVKQLTASMVSYLFPPSQHHLSLPIKGLRLQISTIIKQDAASAKSLISALNTTASSILDHVHAGIDISGSLSEINHALAEIKLNFDATATVLNNATLNAVDDIQFALMDRMLESLDIAAPKEKMEQAKTSEQKHKYLLRVFNLVYIYFFITVSLPSLSLDFNWHLQRILEADYSRPGSVSL